MRKEEEKAKAILNETIINYNRDHSQVHWFQFNNQETELFVSMMCQFSQESNKELLSKIEDLEKDLKRQIELYWQEHEKLQESRQMNERLVEGINKRIEYWDKNNAVELLSVPLIISEFQLILMSTNQSQEKGGEGLC